MEQTINIEELVQDDHNLNKGTEAGQKLMEKSFKELGAGRSILVDKDGRIIAGNKSQKAAMAAGIKKVRVIETEGDELIAVKRTDLSLDSKEGRELAYADNLTTQVNLAWDEIELNHLQTEVDGFDTSDWGFDAKQLAGLEPLVPNAVAESEDEAIERKKKEFEEKMAKGEIGEDDPEYQEFLKKFEPEIKKTTDDCYTPEVVYEAVADWVANEYGLSRANFVRPFYPGGDYQKERYKKSDIVVDNPPFSIMAEILYFYNKNGIRYFLFGPHLTLFSSTNSRCTCLPIGVSVTYANGANICTSFLTNLEDKNIRFRSEPRLYEAVRKANDINRKRVIKENGKMHAKYIYDDHIVSTPFLAQCSRLGFDFVATVDETEAIDQLDSQKAEKKAIFGKGYLISERLLAERNRFEEERYEREVAFQKKMEAEKVEKDKEARAEATVWELSDRERAIIAQLSQK